MTPERLTYYRSVVDNHLRANRADMLVMIQVDDLRDLLQAAVGRVRVKAPSMRPEPSEWR